MTSAARRTIAFGCDYNPEQWGEDVWKEDVALMVEAHVTLVAINIFGWAEIEPRAGEYDFRRLDTIMDMLGAAGIRVNLGTGTSTPPSWLTTAHPEILPTALDGTTRYPGGRQAWCSSSPIFRDAAMKLVEQVAARYASHPALELWHVSNELGCHNALCYCEVSGHAFRVWLEQKYTTLDALNAAWGNAFWSHRYGAWDEILPPLQTISSRNPTHVLDYHRFASAQLCDYFDAEKEIIRRFSDAPVTTNFMVTAHIRNLDYWQWAPHMDVIANDHYLDGRLPAPRAEMQFAADLTRGLAQGEPWILMEHSTGAVNWQPLNRAKAPGQMMLDSLTHMARGADGICFFQWRASLQGNERFHSALLPHAGTDSALWREAVQLGTLVDALGEIAGSRVVSDVAMLFSWEAWWAAEDESRPSSQFGYLDQVHAAHAALTADGRGVDVVSPDGDLSGYQLIVVPGLHLMTPAQAENLRGAVAAGASVLVTFNSAIVDADQRVYAGGYGGPLAEMLGVHVEEFAPVAPGEYLALSDGMTGTLWSERMGAGAAEVLARFEDGPSAGHPALTRHTWGAGTAWYLATQPVADDYTARMARIADDAGSLRVHDEAAAAGVTAVRRRGADADYLFLLNDTSASVALAASGAELVTGTTVTATLEIPAGTVRILKEDRS